MIVTRYFPVAAVAAALFVSAAPVSACPRGGDAVVDDSQTSKAAALLEAARRQDHIAMNEESMTRSENDKARASRMRAARLREQARLSSDVDGAVLLAKAVVAEKEGSAADARARWHAKRAKTARVGAAQLRKQAQALLGDRSFSM